MRLKAFWKPIAGMIVGCILPDEEGLGSTMLVAAVNLGLTGGSCRMPISPHSCPFCELLVRALQHRSRACRASTFHIHNGPLKGSVRVLNE